MAKSRNRVSIKRILKQFSDADELIDTARIIIESPSNLKGSCFDKLNEDLQRVLIVYLFQNFNEIWRASQNEGGLTYEALSSFSPINVAAPDFLYLVECARKKFNIEGYFSAISKNTKIHKRKKISPEKPWVAIYCAALDKFSPKEIVNFAKMIFKKDGGEISNKFQTLDKQTLDVLCVWLFVSSKRKHFFSNLFFDMDGMGAFLSTDEEIKWDRDNGCVYKIYTMSEMSD